MQRQGYGAGIILPSYIYAIICKRVRISPLVHRIEGAQVWVPLFVIRSAISSNFSLPIPASLKVSGKPDSFMRERSLFMPSFAVPGGFQNFICVFQTRTAIWASLGIHSCLSDKNSIQAGEGDGKARSVGDVIKAADLVFQAVVEPVLLSAAAGHVVLGPGSA